MMNNTETKKETETISETLMQADAIKVDASYITEQITSLDNNDLLISVNYSELIKLTQAPALNNSAKKIFINHDKENKKRKIDKKSTVNYFKQCYIVEKDREGNPCFLETINNEHKIDNKVCISKAKMNQEFDRNCLLELHDNAVCYFICTKKTGKEIENKIELSIKSKLKKMGVFDNKNKENASKKEVSEDIKENKDNDNIKNKEDIEKKEDIIIPEYSDILIYKFFIKLVEYDYNNIGNPDNKKAFSEWIDIFNNEVKYYFNKENYKLVETSCNKGIKLIESMPKNTKEKLSNDEYKELMKETWSLYSNKSLVFRKLYECYDKIKDKDKNLDECIKATNKLISLIKGEYSNINNNKEYISSMNNDKYYIKNSLRLAEALIIKKEDSLANEVLDEISVYDNIKNNPDYSKIYNELKQRVVSFSKDKVKISFNFSKGLKKISTLNDEEENENKIEWADCTRHIDYNSNINPSFFKLLNSN